MTESYYPTHCRICGEPLHPFKAPMGVCTSCVFEASQREERVRPSFGFQKIVREREGSVDDDEDVYSEAG